MNKSLKVIKVLKKKEWEGRCPIYCVVCSVSLPDRYTYNRDSVDTAKRKVSIFRYPYYSIHPLFTNIDLGLIGIQQLKFPLTTYVPLSEVVK